MPPVTIVISEDLPAGGPEREAARTLAARWDAQVLVVPPLGDLAADGPAVTRLRQTPGDMIVVSRLYPRAAFWLLQAHGIDGCPAPPGDCPKGAAGDCPNFRLTKMGLSP